MSILGGYLRARESAFFKVEQEAQVQSHRARLIKEGKLDENACEQSQGSSFDDSTAAFDVLPEVLQAQARVDDPNAAQRKQFQRRVKGEPARPSDEDMRRYRTAAAGAYGVVQVPRIISLSGRNRYGIHDLAEHHAAAGNELALRQAPRMSPQQIEVARRSYMAGLRALAYGSLLGLGILAAAVTAAANALDLGAGGNAGSKVQELLEPRVSRLREAAVPVKAWLQGWLALSGPSDVAPPPSEFQAALQTRYNPKTAMGTSPRP